MVKHVLRNTENFCDMIERQRDHHWKRMDDCREGEWGIRTGSWPLRAMDVFLDPIRASKLAS